MVFNQHHKKFKISIIKGYLDIMGKPEIAYTMRKTPEHACHEILTNNLLVLLN
jgi:hypothetical protein